jgi:protein TonB
MRTRISAMLMLSATAHAAVLAPAYFTNPFAPLSIAAAPLSVALTSSAERHDDRPNAARAAPPSIAARPRYQTPAASAPDADAAGNETGADDRLPELGRDRANHLRASLVTQMSRYFVYPMLARRRGWQGEVAVALRIEPDGRVRALRVARSSGYAVLDRDALATLNRVGVLPRAAAWLNGHAYDTEVPVIYRLTEG